MFRSIAHHQKLNWFILRYHRVVPQFGIAKLVPISPITMVFVGDISIVNGIITHL